MRHLARARAPLALVLSLLLMAPASASAQAAPPDSSRELAAQALYEKATAEMDARSYATACPKLEEVTRLVPDGLGAKLTLAECYEAMGRLASAWAQFALVEAMASKAGQAPRAQVAAQRAAALKPRLALLTIDVPASVRAIPGLSVLGDGVPVGEPQWGTPLPVDTGQHVVVATAPGRKPWTQTFVVKADGVKIDVTVQEPPIDPAISAGRGNGGSGSGPGPGPGPGPSSGDERSFQRPLAIATMGLGTAGIIVGSVLGSLAISKFNDSNADNHCDSNGVCDDTGLVLRKQAVGLGNGSTVAFIAGAAVLAGGVVLFATAPAQKVSPSTTSRAPSGFRATIEIAPARVQVKGSW